MSEILSQHRDHFVGLTDPKGPSIWTPRHNIGLLLPFGSIEHIVQFGKKGRLPTLRLLLGIITTPPPPYDSSGRGCEGAGGGGFDSAAGAADTDTPECWN